MVPEDGMGRDEAIDRFWDQVTQGRADAAGDLDPADAATIRYLHAADDRSRPSLAFRRHLREDLMHAHAIPVTSEPSSRPLSNGRVRQPWSGAPLALPSSRSRWVLTQLATAALVLLILVGTVLTYGASRSWWPADGPTLLPAISGSPATPPPVLTDTLLDAPVAALPAGRVRVAVDRWRLQPSPAAVTLPAYTGVVLMTVDTGEVMVTVTGRDQRLDPGAVLDVTGQELPSGRQERCRPSPTSST